ncbi:unnamed protein product, partial [Cyprideis torosa]
MTQTELLKPSAPKKSLFAGLARETTRDDNCRYTDDIYGECVYGSDNYCLQGVYVPPLNSPATATRFCTGPEYLRCCLYDIPMTFRSEWGAQKPNRTTPLSNPEYLIVHHTATRGCDDLATCTSVLKEIQTDHMTHPNKSYDDIGYNFLIGGDGVLYEGRGFDKEGAHAAPYNPKSIGIAMIGTFTENLPTQKALLTLNYIIYHHAEKIPKGWGGINGWGLPPSYHLLGHRQVKPTECPGEALYNYIKTAPETFIPHILPLLNAFTFAK